MNTAKEGIAYCTIASANYLAKVQTLLASFERYQPDASVEVLLCEAPDVCQRISEETGRRFWSPEDVCPTWRPMAFYYDVIEFNTALKPFFMARLLERGLGGVVYLDPDIELYSSLAPIEDLLREYDVVLTPHACKPVALDGNHPAIDEYLRAGQFNLGFIGMSGTANARNMLEWWQHVCLQRCLFDATHRYFVDQFWAAAFASFADRCCVLRDPGFNVAYWNIFQRNLARVANEWRVDDRPLRFFHFSGVMDKDLTKVSRYQDRVQAQPGSALFQILSEYVARVANMSWKQYADMPYSFDRYSDGRRIEPSERRKFLYLSSEERAQVGDPFQARDAIRKIVTVNLAAHPRAYLTRLSWEGYGRQVIALMEELMHKLRTRGVIETGRLVCRFVMRRIFGNS